MALNPESEEVFAYSEDVSPGYVYNPSTKEYSPGNKMQMINIETYMIHNFDFLCNLSLLRNSEVMKGKPWIKDFDTQKEGSFSILLRGQKICEKKGNVEPHPMLHVVSSVSYKSFIEVLICFSHDFEDKNLEELKDYINAVICMKEKNINTDYKSNQPDTDVAEVPPTIFHSFSKAYIYQRDKRIPTSSIKHGIEEFCHHLIHTQTSKSPVSCNVLKPQTTNNEPIVDTPKKPFIYPSIEPELSQCTGGLSDASPATVKPNQRTELAATHNSQNSRKYSNTNPMSKQYAEVVKEPEHKNTHDQRYPLSVKKKEFPSVQTLKSRHQQSIPYQSSDGKSYPHKESTAHSPSEVPQADYHNHYSRNASCPQSKKNSEYVENISQAHKVYCKDDQSVPMVSTNFTVQNHASNKKDQVECKSSYPMHADDNVIHEEKHGRSMKNSQLKHVQSSDTHKSHEESQSHKSSPSQSKSNKTDPCHKSNLSQSKSNEADPLSTLLMPSEELEVCGMTRKYYGVHSKVEGKTIILLGASGSGKTTLVNFIANYHSGIKAADCKLVKVARSSNDTEGRTTQITGYTFCAGENGIPITIIDTPGLNDSSGAEVQDHVQSLKTFLANVGSQNIKIHAIGFVAQAHIVRLTSSERLVMDYVSSLLGKEVGNHVISFVTFSDSQEVPPVVEAIKNYGVTCSASLKFSNSALSSNKEEDLDELDRIYWRIGCKSWRKCLKLIEKLPPLSFKSLQDEIHVSQFVELAEKNLRTEIMGLVNHCGRNKPLTKEMLSNAKTIWTLAGVVQELKCVNMSSCPNLDDILIRYVQDVCKEINCQQVSRECVKLLSLSPSRPLLKAGLGIISSAAPIYYTVKQIIAQSQNQHQQSFQSVLFCHNCEKYHVLERIKQDSKFKIKFWSPSEIVYKCKVCQCDEGVHGEKSIENRNHNTAEPGQFTPMSFLHHTRNCIAQVLKDMCLPKHLIPEDEYLKYLKCTANREEQLLCNDLLAMTSEVTSGQHSHS